MTPQEQIKYIRDALASVSVGGFPTFTVTSSFVEAMNNLVTLVEEELFEGDELYVIWVALNRYGNPVAVRLADRVEKMHKARVKGGYV